MCLFRPLCPRQGLGSLWHWFGSWLLLLLYDWLLFFWKFDFYSDIIIDELLRLKLHQIHGRQFLGTRNVFLFQHCFVLAVKLLIMDPI